MQVVKVTFGVLLFGICALFSLRFYGLSQRYQAYDHPVLKIPTPWVLAWGGDQSVSASHSRTALQAAYHLEGVMLAANIQINANKHFFVVPVEYDLSKARTDRKFIDLTDAEVGKLDLGDGKAPLPLEEFLALYSERPVLLWVGDNVENIDLRLEPILKKQRHPQNILLHSEYDVVVKSLKKLLPEMLYGTGVGQRIRMLMLGSLWLETVSPLDGDFLIAPLKQQGVSAISIELKDEVLRRQKVFILGPLNDIAANDQALAFGASAYLTAFPADLKNKLSAHSAGVDLSPASL
jgi:hypothetical protein